MDTSNLVNQLVDAQVAAKQGGSIKPFFNANAAKVWKQTYPSLPVEDAGKLMALIDGNTQAAAASRSEGNTQSLVSAISKAQTALAEIYGINAYTPKGTQNQNVPSD